MDTASTMLARRAISGSSSGTAEIKFVETVEVEGKRKNVVYLHFKLDTVFIKSWNISGDADDRPTEDVTLWYNRIAFNYWATTDGKEFKGTSEVEWDQVAAKKWSGGAIGRQGTAAESFDAE
jgi:type VI secretion system secreted protein Hcp